MKNVFYNYATLNGLYEYMRNHCYDMNFNYYYHLYGEAIDSDTIAELSRELDIAYPFNPFPNAIGKYRNAVYLYFKLLQMNPVLKMAAERGFDKAIMNSFRGNNFRNIPNVFKKGNTIAEMLGIPEFAVSEILKCSTIKDIENMKPFVKKYTKCKEDFEYFKRIETFVKNCRAWGNDSFSPTEMKRLKYILNSKQFTLKSLFVYITKVNAEQKIPAITIINLIFESIRAGKAIDKKPNFDLPSLKLAFDLIVDEVQTKQVSYRMQYAPRY